MYWDHRHLLCELKELENVLKCTSGTNTPIALSKDIRRRIGLTPSTLSTSTSTSTSTSKSTTKPKRISPVLLSTGGSRANRRTVATNGGDRLDFGGNQEKGSRTVEKKSPGSLPASNRSSPERSLDNERELRQENAKLKEEVAKLQGEKEALRKQMKLHRLDKEEAMKKVKQARSVKQEQDELNEKLRAAYLSSEKKCKRLSDRLSVGDRSFNLMKEKYNQVNQECIDLTFSLSYLKQDYAYTYQVVDGGTVKVLEEAQSIISSFAKREKFLVEEVEDLQTSLEDLEGQVCLLNEILKVDAKQKDNLIRDLRGENKSFRSQIDAMSEGFLDGERIAKASREVLEEYNHQILELAKETGAIREVCASVEALGDMQKAAMNQVGLITDLMEEKKNQIQREVALTSNRNADLAAQLKRKDREIRKLKAKLPWN